MNDQIIDNKPLKGQLSLYWDRDEWQRCYPSNWKNKIVPDAIAHPAKFSSKLIRKIYEHMLEEEWLKAGDVVIDPFGGVALGAMDAMRIGCAWRGVELEARFVDLGNRNIAFWNEKFSALPNWSRDAELLQGDSRKLCEVLRDAQASVSSPPFGSAQSGGGIAIKGYSNEDQRKGSEEEPFDLVGKRSYMPKNQGESDGQLGNMPVRDESFQASVSSPPFLQSEGGTPEPKPGGAIDEALYARHRAGNAASNAYGEEDGNLGNMRGSEEDFQGAISSPPYADGAQHTGGDDKHPEHVKGGKIHLPGIAGSVSSPPYAATEGAMKSKKFKDPEKTASELSQKMRDGTFKNANYASEEAILRSLERANEQDYGSTPGQLGAMKAGDFDPSTAPGADASVSSPPYESGVVKSRSSHLEKDRIADKNLPNVGRYGMTGNLLAQEQYGLSEGQLGNDSGDDFWTAARTIVEQTYAALAPGAHAVWVVKDFVKNKERVPFCDQWQQLCEAVGFVTLHEHRAMLVHHKGTQMTLTGDDVEIKTESKSFFRRVAEKKGSPRIDWETVWCMEKPA